MESSSNIGRGIRPEHAALGREWKRLSRAATVVAVLTSPAFLLFLVEQGDWPVGWALIGGGAVAAVALSRALATILKSPAAAPHRLLPRPSCNGHLASAGGSG